MQWKIDEGPKPTVGDTKKEKIFAWFPAKMSDGWWVWLEHYMCGLEYRDTRNFSGKRILKWKIVYAYRISDDA